jgi:Mn2+/Fe2+ NRAMP family transporter
VGEGRRWPVGLARQPKEAIAFYSVLAVSAVLGAAITLSPIDPIQALYWSAVINGVVAAPVMVVMMRITANRRVMGQFTIRGALRWLGWVSTAAMTLCVVAMITSWAFR